MPKLGNIKTTRLYLPSTKDSDDPAWVEVKDRLLTGDMVDLTAAETNMDKALVGLTSFIADWNFTEDGTPDSPKLPITQDNMRMMDQEDFQFLAEAFSEAMSVASKGLGDEEKKSSSSISVTVQTADDQTPPDSQTTT